jgi:hypothetical protein
MNNLADHADFSSIKKELRAALEKELLATDDPRIHGREIFESYPRVSPMRDFPGFKERGEYNPEYQ